MKQPVKNAVEKREQPRKTMPKKEMMETVVYEVK